ncbi:Recombinase [uncultured Clostridium sp.]|uniref:recombinase family protein n=1 Tax=uncultured Clostridium sp. TaxID=59620 RepID=UPI0008229253|nr:recombinase family protein [uncultured Clostridium sp.]SCJ00342.1 Recombinase [uncultured Clostridium sp.]
MKKKRVAFFSRVSTMDQHSSIENQQKIFTQWLERNPDCEYYKMYEDEGISGAKGYKRIKWLQMLEDGKNELYDVVVCKSFSRFGRNIVETLSAIKELRTKGIRCVFLEDGLDSEKDASKFGLFAWLAEEEANKTSNRIKTVWDSFNKEGKIHVTVAPYGYDYSVQDKNFVVNEDEREVVKNIFNLYLQGYGFNRIAQMLIENNIPTKKGGSWAGATIQSILTNEFYIGTLVQGKTRTIDATMKENIKIDESEWFRHENRHEAIVDIEVFKKVNRQIEERSKKAKGYYTKEHGNAKRNSNKSLFSNLLICGECGSMMTIKRKKKEKYKPHYQCLNYDRISLKCGHKSNRINESELVQIVKNKLINLSEDNFRRLKNMQIKNRDKKDVKVIEKEITMINKKIEQQINLSNNLLMLFTNGTIKEEQFKLQNESIYKALNGFMERKNVLEEELKVDVSKEQETVVFTGIEYILNKPVEEWKNSELKEFIENIKIFIDGTIELKVKYFN